jgi:hypothetical protein
MQLTRRSALVVVAMVLGLVASGCYTIQAQYASDNATPVPWFCRPVAPNSVTGPGMGSVDYYAGVTRAPLDYDQCKQVAGGLDLAKAYAKQFPTLGDAKAAGMHNGFDFIAGMGTHTGFTVTPQLLADPNFDPQDPIIPGSNIDGVFDPAEPEFLQYNGNTDDSVLVGLDYYVRTENGLPPAGFVGNNDWWHHHPTLCVRPNTGTAFTVNTTDQACATQGGINLHMQKYFMLHVWLVDGLEYYGDVHAPMHPCIKSTGAIFDMSDPCHTSLLPGGGAAARSSAGDAATPAVEAAFCPIGRLSETPA